MRRIDQVSCSLNLGYIFSLDYSYTPEGGVQFTLFFDSVSGIYTHPVKMQKAFIRVGTAAFSVYVVASEISYSAGKRVISVDFVDELFQLNNYHVVLTGKGCGQNVYQLGTPVDNRTLAQKQANALDPVAKQIEAFTQFPDVEYTFNDFLAILRQRFNVAILAAVDVTLTNVFTGTFREVLDAWCKFYNLAFFFENGIIKVFNPVNLIITLPTVPPAECIDFTSSEDIRDTYGKTVCNWFQQSGGEKALNQTSNSDGHLFVRTQTLFPVGYEYNLTQTTLDLNQVVAAQYGDHFWFLYNYYKGTTATNCGWTPLQFSSINNSNIYTSIRALNQANGNVQNAGIAVFDETTYNAQFQAFANYGKSIGGRYYLSTELGNGDLAIEQNFQWFNEADGQIFDFTTPEADAKKISLQFISPPPTTSDENNDLTVPPSVLDGTVINQYYPGINYVGDRIVYVDNRKIDFETEFALDAATIGLVNETYQLLFSIKGSENMDFSEVGDNKFQGYLAYPIPQNLSLIFDALTDKAALFQPQFTSIPIKGISKSDYLTLKTAVNEPNDVKIVTGPGGPNVVANTGIIKTLKNGTYTIYYDKYADCASAASPAVYFQHRFEPKQVSSDIAISFNFSKQANNTYRLTRDFNTLNAIIHNPLLAGLAQPRTFPTKRVSYSLNYFQDVPVNFLTNGLVGLKVSFGGAGVTATYSFSNEMLAVPDRANQFAQWEQQVRNSWIRQYSPKEVIS